jgi:hypothetical protein
MQLHDTYGLSTITYTFMNKYVREYSPIDGLDVLQIKPRCRYDVEDKVGYADDSAEL